MSNTGSAIVRALSKGALTGDELAVEIGLAGAFVSSELAKLVFDARAAVSYTHLTLPTIYSV